ncbi:MULTISPECIES: hypothetical protein [Rhizobium]|uniref:Uncharacterized protein n=1 Tax=Rhizobium paranaense TaxID=1650438 RepID=A0A7W8XSX6_9HYPH|nr:hypothetical protein [Rhizobium paranaense]MBB5574990.1 hypothetical protein [Rhizobium paranaense]
MMKIGHGVEVLDLYEWLPGHGETRVEIRMEGAELIVAVTYDDEAIERERKLRFSSVCSFYLQTFPGPTMLGIETGDANPILRGVLVEYPDSEAAAAWRRHFNHSRSVRHYSIAFLAENLLLAVWADSVSVSK